MRHVPFVDSTGLKNLRETILQLKNEGTYIVLSGVSESVKKDLLKGGIGELVGLRIFTRNSIWLYRLRKRRLKRNNYKKILKYERIFWLCIS